MAHDLQMAIASLIDAVKYLRRGDASTCDEKLKRASRHLLKHIGPDPSCSYCHGEGVERIVGRDNDVIERPCPNGCPTPMREE